MSIVTDRIATFTETGIELESGRELDADLIVTATGLNLLAIGGVELEVDGEPVAIRDRMVYKGMMLNGVPNFAFAFGYTNASWTLKADLTCKYVARVLHPPRSCRPSLSCRPPRFHPWIRPIRGWTQSDGCWRRMRGNWRRQTA